MQNNFNYNSYLKYQVKPGDSLYKIAKTYNTTVDNIKSINNLVTNTIYPNQILLVPNYYKTDTCINNDYPNYHNKSIDEIIDMLNIKCINKTPNTNKIRVTKELTIDEILKKYNLSAYDLLKLNENKILQIDSDIIVA